MTFLGGHNLDIITFPSHHSLPFNHSLTNSHLHTGAHLISWHLSFIDLPCSYGLYFIKKFIHWNRSHLCHGLLHTLLTGVLGYDVGICFSTPLCLTGQYQIPLSPLHPFSEYHLSLTPSSGYDCFYVSAFLPSSASLKSVISPPFTAPLLSSFVLSCTHSLQSIALNHFLNSLFLSSCFLAPTGYTSSKASLFTFQTFPR